MNDFAQAFPSADFPMRGRHLIAASAGTGKTYNMQNVFARLVMQKGIPVTKILVVTFTKAATAELCDRLRRILANVRDFLEKDRSVALSQDMALDPARRQALALVSRISERDWPLARSRVLAAIAEFDQAAISTIHGFCDRVLKRFAFESGANFDTEVGESNGVGVLADDAWRKLGCDKKEKFSKHGKDMFCPAVERLASSRAIFDEPCENDQESAQSRLVFDSATAVREKQKVNRRRAEYLSYDELLLQVRDALRVPGEQLSEKLRGEYSAVLIDEFQDTDPVQYEIFSRVFWIDEHYDACPSFVVGDPKQAIYAFRGGDIFTYRTAVGEIPEARRYDLCKNFRSTGGIIQAVNRMFGDVNGQYTFGDPSIAYEGNIAYNDKIRPLRIDGSDDSHPFRVVKAEDWDDLKPQLIRQIHSLLKEERPHIYDKDLEDYRSVTASDIAVLVSSNEFGRGVSTALIEEGIPAVCMTDTTVFSSHTALNILSLMQMLQNTTYLKLLRGGLNDNVLFGLSQRDILALSQDGSGIDLSPDWNFVSGTGGKFSMANLTELLERRFAQWTERGFAAMLSTLAEKTGIYRRLPCMVGGERVLTDLGQLLELIQEYENENGVNPTAETAWFANRIAGASESNEDEQQRLESDENAVVVMTIHKAKGLEFPIVFVPIGGGARLPKWAKKGLDGRQWCGWPKFVFDPVKYSTVNYACYHSVCDNALHAFSRMEDTDRNSSRNRQTEREIKEENIRKLYVAFTRAAQRCVVVTFSGADPQCDEILARLGGESPCASEKFIDASDAENVAADDDVNGLEAGDASSADKPTLRKPLELPKLLHDEDVGSYSMLAPKHGSIFIGTSDPEDDPVDEMDDERMENESAIRIYGARDELPMKELPLFRCFGSGTDAGTRMHLLFENIPLLRVDAANPSPEVVSAIRSAMGGVATVRESPDDGEAINALVKMLDGVGRMQLPPFRDGDVGFALRDVAIGKQMHEWRFDFSSTKARVTTEAMFSAIERHWRDDPTKADFITAIRQCKNFKEIPSGWMTGAIDLLFESGGRIYVVDWKSNRMGAYRSEFSHEGLFREMARNFYFFQYLVYSAAVHRYLSECLPGYTYERNFGGVYYVFIRAFAFDDAAAEDAVFSDRPSRELLEEIGDMLGLKGE